MDSIDTGVKSGDFTRFVPSQSKRLREKRAGAFSASAHRPPRALQSLQQRPDVSILPYYCNYLFVLSKNTVIILRLLL